MHIPNSARVKELLEQEETEGYNSLEVYEEFRERVFNSRIEFRRLLARLNASGHRVYGYGASTKGNVVLQFCDVSNQQLRGIAEVNQDKFGAFTPHNLIPIASEEDIKSAGVDYFVVFPWHFRTNILEREKDFLANGGNLIFPLPHLEVVSGKTASKVAA
jgi:hypothetical protein